MVPAIPRDGWSPCCGEAQPCFPVLQALLPMAPTAVGATALAPSWSGQPKPCFTAQVLSLWLVQAVTACPVPAALHPSQPNQAQGWREAGLVLQWGQQDSYGLLMAVWQTWPAQVGSGQTPDPEGCPSMQKQLVGSSGELSSASGPATSSCMFLGSLDQPVGLWTVLWRSESPPGKTGMFTQSKAILTAMC